MAKAVKSPDALAADLADLPDQSLPALRERWKGLYGHPPPPTLRRDLFVRAIAYQLQVKAYGGLSAATKMSAGDLGC